MMNGESNRTQEASPNKEWHVFRF